jgi:hypothetical protein
MKSQIITLTPEAERLIPYSQLIITREIPEAYSDAIERLNAIAQLIPGIGKTDGMKEHPAALHYFYAGLDFYIAEFDGNDLFFGYAILNGDFENSEFGYSSLSKIKSNTFINLDYYFKSQSIEQALYTKYPTYFGKP